MGVLQCAAEYVSKYRGNRAVVPPPLRRPPVRHLISTFVSSFIAIAILAILQNYVFVSVSSTDPNLTFLIGSFGATAVLIYGMLDAPVSQPRNVFFGHVFSAIIGVSCAMIFKAQSIKWLGTALSVSIALFVMQVTKTVHPPGGATALIATLGPENIYQEGWYYILVPVMLGVVIMLAVAVVVNNVLLRYPLYWMTPVITPLAAQQTPTKPSDEAEEVEYLSSIHWIARCQQLEEQLLDAQQKLFQSQQIETVTLV